VFSNSIFTCWLLLTTLAVSCFEDVVQALRWYTYRWLIERYHFVLKSGCRLEQLQLETSDRIQRDESYLHDCGVAGGYFISYPQLEQWVAACCTLIRACRDLKALKLVWSAIEREATRYTEEGFNRLSEIHAQRQAYLHPH
jgi:hypothetical protein